RESRAPPEAVVPGTIRLHGLFGSSSAFGVGPAAMIAITPSRVSAGDSDGVEPAEQDRQEQGGADGDAACSLQVRRGISGTWIDDSWMDTALPRLDARAAGD
ncbi:MAG: hypothetical protein GY895_11610, partial [Phycisphaera sp.]|nr:hypothetical protein [Phycisphaera sp.]